MASKKQKQHKDAPLIAPLASAIAPHPNQQHGKHTQAVVASPAITQTGDSVAHHALQEPGSVADTRRHATDGGALVEWEWCSDTLVWTPFSPSLSATIEEAFQSGKPGVNFQVARNSYTVCFQSFAHRQTNLLTRRTRPVGRQTADQGTCVSWLWWEDETQHWHAYDVDLAARIEETWKECSLSRTVRKQNAPAGLSFILCGRAYIIEFEADAVQYNVITQFSRGLRRHCSNVAPEGGLTSSAFIADNVTSNATGCQSQGERGRSWTSSSDSHSRPRRLSNPFCPSQAHSRASDEILKRPSYNSAEIMDHVSPSDIEDCSICLGRLQEEGAVMLMKCKHSYHRECIESWFQTRPSCPECLTLYGTIVGTQPPGEMHVNYITYGSEEASSGLAGYPKTDIIRITYRFPNGIQTAEHPNPGSLYAGTVRVAYLPKNKDGEEVLELLKKAWNHRLLFCVGTSVTTGQSDVVTWSGIHHKTRTSGGSSNHGFPDETYFSRVKKELEEFGIV